MRRQIFAIQLLMLFAAGREAHAARYGLLLYGALQQEVDFSYQLNGDQQSTSSLRQEAIEEYTFRMKYGLGNLNLWRGSAMFTLRTDQSLNSNSRSGSSGVSSRLGLLYDIDGVIMGRSVAPAAFSVKSDVTEVSTPFAKNYSVTNTLYDVRWSLKNKTLPVAIEYITGTSVTSGQVVDSTRNRKELYLHATQTGVAGTSSLDLSNVRSDYSTTVGENTFDQRYEAKFQHGINWNVNTLERNFSTGLDYSETAGINNAKYLTLTESVQWALGKSLVAGGDYSYVAITGDPGAQTRQNGIVWLQHQLFKNLMTRITGRVRNDEYPAASPLVSGGKDQEIGGGITLSYVKELPKQSSLNLSGNKDYSVEKRNLGTDTLHISLEQHTVAIVGPPLRLVQPNAVTSSIVIKNTNPARTATLTLNDYQVVTTGALTDIVFTASAIAAGTIVDGDSLQIDYDVKVDPNLKTVSNSFGLNGSLALFSGAYRVYGSYQQTNQDRTGQVTLAGNTAQNMTRLGLERKWNFITANTEYVNFVSEVDKHQSVQAQALYSNSKREGSLTFTLSDQYQWYDPVVVGNTTVTRPAENFFSAATGYSTMLSTTTNVALNANYLNISGAGNSDSLSMGSSLHFGLGKLNVIMNTSFGVRRQENIIGYNELFYVRVTRYF